MKQDSSMPNREERWEGEGGQPDPSLSEKTLSRIPIEKAVRAGDYELVKNLLSEGEDPNVRMRGGMTPLHVAADFGCEATLLMIVSLGGDINIQDDEGMTPLMHAIMSEENEEETVKDILKIEGLDLLLKNNAGETAHDVATRLGKESLANLVAL